MSLREIPLSLCYGREDNPLHSFYVPALSQSARYDRLAGFFSSGALAVAAAGVARLVASGGRMRLLVGAHLNPDDVAEIQRGHALPERVAQGMAARLASPEDLEDALMRSRLEVLAWLVAEGRLELRVVLPTDPDGRPIPAPDSQDYFHPKVGVLTDPEANQLAFIGSVNESAAGWQSNYELFLVFRSWAEQERLYVAELAARFERLWQDQEQGWIALQVPDAVSRRLLTYQPSRPPRRDPLERETPAVADQRQVLELTPTAPEREQILARFLLDAPHFPGATRLGFATAAVTPWPHQLRVAARIVDSTPARYLLSDEVGLGKTIEAGLVLRQLLLSGAVGRVLILAPRSLCRQWQEELYEKFALRVPFYDGHRFTDVFDTELIPPAGNPWEAFPVMLASAQLARRQDRWRELLAASRWDLVIVDEAHHARRRDFLTPRYRPNRLLSLLNELEQRTDGLLLLTATPMQVHRLEVWDLLRLLGLGGRWGADEDTFLRFFNELHQAQHRPRDADLEGILAVVAEERVDPAVLAEARRDLGPVETGTLETVLRGPGQSQAFLQLSRKGQAWALELVRRHTPLRHLVFRNTRHLLRRYQERGLLSGSVPTRDPRLVWVKMSDAEEDFYHRIEEYITQFYQRYEDERKGLGFVMTVYRRRLTSSLYALGESLKRRLEFLRGQPGQVQWLTDDDLEEAELAADITDEVPLEDRARFRQEMEYVQQFLDELRLVTSDSKTARLLSDVDDVLRRRETVLVFTQYTDTMDYLRSKLQVVSGQWVACYSGRGGERWNGVDWVPVGKEQIKEAFRKAEIKILVATEAASEGLNLQTCGVLINYDVPWNPMRVEQRIGRIDRIGQLHDQVWIYNYFYEATVEARVYRALERRIQWFKDVVGELQPILYQVGQAIETVAMTPRDEQERRLAQEIAALHRMLNERERVALALEDYLEEGAPDTAAPPLSLGDLETFLTGSQALQPLLRPHPDTDGAHLLSWDGTDFSVTFQRETYDQHPYTLRLLTWGDPLFEKVLSRVAGPPPDTAGGLLRLETASPTLVGYYAPDGDVVRRLETFAEVEGWLARDAQREWSDSLIEKARQDLEDQALEMRASRRAQRQRHLQALRQREWERARLVLLRAALLELAMGQQPGLFEEQNLPHGFSTRAVSGLARHGYPFAPLLRLVGAEGLVPSPLDPFYLALQAKSRSILEAQFRALREQAVELVRQLVRDAETGEQ